MANIVPDSFKTDLLGGVFDFDSGGSTFKLALYTSLGALIYKGTSNEAVLVLDFGGSKTATNGDFVIQFPAADASNAIIRIGDA
jgi:hypothetical protein